MFEFWRQNEAERHLVQGVNKSKQKPDLAKSEVIFGWNLGVLLEI